MSGSNRIMKHTVLSSGLLDADIRPPALLSEFRRLSLRDARTFFGASDALEAVACPACGADEPGSAFDKDGFSFVQCDACRSVYVSPRPRAALLARYFAESEASAYRAAAFAGGTAEQRRRHLLRGNASWMGQVVEQRGLPPRPAYADVRTYVAQLFDEVVDLDLFGDLYAVEPRVPLGAHADVAVRVVTATGLPEVHVISAFEKLEHQHAPQTFLEGLRDRLVPGGLLFLTTRTCSGFDLQMLWDKAAYIYVPEHLNLLSIPGLEALLQRSGLELVELSTPGQLDVELVLQAAAADPSIVLPPFFQTLLADRGALAHRDFQAFLQKHRLSSHVRIAARRPG